MADRIVFPRNSNPMEYRYRGVVRPTVTRWRKLPRWEGVIQREFRVWEDFCWGPDMESEEKAIEWVHKTLDTYEDRWQKVVEKR